MIGKIQDMLAGSIAIGIGKNNSGASAAPEVQSSTQASSDATQQKVLPQNPAAVSSIGGKEQASEMDEFDAAINQALDPENQKMSEETVSQMTQELNELMGKINCSLEFSYNKEVDVMSVKMINSETGDTIREYPPEDLIKGMIKAREWIGAFLDRNA